ncbi:hypothetical protein [Spirosoma endophyticum]|uniref:YcxB-like protein n=1 Tax=Spirosoma endophyticum TaxID=662367 RepID=A0A1I1KW18_9BACT|nr:hypothetical protein [Spirosoma endophyticum]SFC64996.1 hypothetical protein SAMN05216167_10265 [Spirosoma endophyticum]
MRSFVFSENTDQYKTLIWRQFYHSQKVEFFQRKRVQTIVLLIVPFLLLLAYFANHNTNNLVAAFILFLVLCFWILLFFVKRNLVKKSIADFPNRHLYTITLDEETIIYATAVSQSEIKWSYFPEYEEFEKNFTLYPREKPREPIYLPLSFASDSEDLAALIRQKVKKKE